MSPRQRNSKQQGPRLAWASCIGDQHRGLECVREMKHHNVIVIIPHQLLYTKAFELFIFSTYIY